MSLEQALNLISQKRDNLEPNADELRIMKQYFNIDNDDPWTKYKKMFPNMYPCIINSLVMEDLLSKCKNRGERRQLLKDIKKHNKDVKKQNGKVL